MALFPTKQIELGFKMPVFNLPDSITDLNTSNNDIRGEKGTLVVFICNHCPYVLHIINELVELSNEFIKKGIGVVAISSNDIINYPEDSPEKMKEFAKAYNFTFPYLYDESQDVAKKYFAACTPDFNLFDANDNCVYRGQFDSSRPGNSLKVDGRDLRNAFEAVIAGKPKIENQIPSTGCGIKWKQ